jgi:hypothetical protein
MVSRVPWITCSLTTGSRRPSDSKRWRTSPCPRGTTPSAPPSTDERGERPPPWLTSKETVIGGAKQWLMKIKSIIEKIQTKVDQAIDKLIDRVMKEAPLEAKQRELADFLPRPKRLRSREGYAREDFRSRQQDRAHARIDDGGVRLLLGSDVDRRRQRRNARPRPHRGEEASQRRA